MKRAKSRSVSSLKMRRKKALPRLLLVGTTTTLACLGIASFAATRLLPPEAMRSVLPENGFTRLLEEWLEPKIQRVQVKDPIARKIVRAAHAQEGDAYNARYRKISYPNGDVPKGAGACTDVVVRALRGAGYDLQRLIHQDMTQDFERYPDSWKLGHPDPNIDHRRVPNHITFFKKYGKTLPLETSGAAAKTWLPGDIVMWRPQGKTWHTGVVSDAIGPSGHPTVIHNGWICMEQDCLSKWPIVGHFRFPK